MPSPPPWVSPIRHHHYHYATTNRWEGVQSGHSALRAPTSGVRALTLRCRVAYCRCRRLGSRRGGEGADHRCCTHVMLGCMCQYQRLRGTGSQLGGWHPVAKVRTLCTTWVYVILCLTTRWPETPACVLACLADPQIDAFYDSFKLFWACLGFCIFKYFWGAWNILQNEKDFVNFMSPE